MPHSPVLAAHELFAALNRDDRTAVLALLDEDVEILPAGDPQPGALERGLEGARRWLADLDAQGRGLRLYVSDARELDARAVCAVAVARQVRNGVLEIRETVWTVLALNERGLIASSWSYLSEAEALAAAREGTPFPVVRRRSDER